MGFNVSVHNAKHKLYIGVWYRPPANLTALDELHSILETLDVTSFVLLGDFNIDFCNSNHPLLRKLSSFLHSSSHRAPHPHEPFNTNRSCTTVKSLQLVACNVIRPLSNSDHNGMHTTLKWFPNSTSIKNPKRTVWRYSHANFERANCILVATDWSFLDVQFDIDALWSTWEQKFMTVMQERLLREPALRLARADEICRAAESTVTQVKLVGNTTAETVSTVNTSERSTPECQSCG